MENYGLMMGVEAHEYLENFDKWHKNLVLSYSDSQYLDAFAGLEIKGIRVLMPKKWHERFNLKQRKYVLKWHQIELENPEWVILTIGKCANDNSIMKSMANELYTDHVQFESITEIYFSSPADPPNPGFIGNIWKESIGSPIIPFADSERNKIIMGFNDQYEHHLNEWIEE